MGDRENDGLSQLKMPSTLTARKEGRKEGSPVVIDRHRREMLCTLKTSCNRKAPLGTATEAVNQLGYEEVTQINKSPHFQGRGIMKGLQGV